MEENKFNYTFKGPRIFQLVKFEMASWIGRRFFKKRGKIRTTEEPILLDLGVGANYSNGWLHADFFQIHFKFWKKHAPSRKPEIEFDLRYPVDCSDNIVDGIYSGHTLEHLYPYEALRLIKEMYRILKPSGWIRINVPDLGKYVNYYIGNPSEPEFNQFGSGCMAISMLTQNYGHHSVWDETILIHALESVGFKKIKKVEFGSEGYDKRLIKEEKIRKWETIVMEAQKPA